MQKEAPQFVRRCKSTFVWYQVSFVYEVEALRGFWVEDLWQSMQTPDNLCANYGDLMQTMNQDL